MSDAHRQHDRSNPGNRAGLARLRRHDVVAIVVLYAAAGTAWILLSDALLLLAPDPTAAAILSVTKGLGFVAVTSLLLYALLRRVRTAHAATVTEVRSRGFESTIRRGIFAATVVIVVLGVLQVQSLVSADRREQSSRLDTIADFKSARLADWLDERLRDAETLARELSADPSAFLARPPDALAERLETYRRIMGYQSAAVVDVDAGVVVKSAKPFDPPSALRFTVERALADGTPRISDLYHVHDERADHLHLDFVAPLPDGGATRLVVLTADGNELHANFLVEWPIPSETAETLLFRSDGENLLLMNPPRHAPDLPVRLPISGSNQLAARIAAGELPTGVIVRGVDYRGIEVAGTARRIGDTAWYLLAKIDRRELVAALTRRLSWTIGGIAFALILPLAVGLLLAQRARLRVMELVDRQREERVALARHQSSLIDQARDMVLLFDDAGCIVDANRSALAAYGYELEEMQALTAAELRAPDSREDLDLRASQADQPEGVLFETTHVRKDGSPMPVEISSRSLEIEGRVYRQAFIRDISERRRNEARIARLTALYHALSECNQAIVRSRDRDGLFTEVCRVVVEYGGMAMAWIGVAGAGEAAITAAAVYGDGGREYVGGLHLSLDAADPYGQGPTGVAMREDRAVFCQDFLGDSRTAPWHEAAGRHGWRASASLPVHQDGRVAASLNVYARTTDAFGEDEKKLLAELALDLSYALEHIATRKALEEAEERWSFALEGSGEGVWDWNIVTGAVYFSPRWKQMLGYRVDEIGDSFDEWQSRVHPEDLVRTMADIETTLAGATEQLVNEHRMRTRDGDYIWILDRGKVVAVDAGGKALRMIGTHADITERKCTEQTLLEQALMLEESQRIAHIGSWRYEPAAATLIWSAETGRILGVGEPASGAALDAFLEHVHGDDRDTAAEWFDTLLDQRQPDEIEMRIVRPDGELRWVNCRGVLSRDALHALVYAAGTVQDVTEWHAVESRLKNQLDELRRWHRITLEREQRMVELKGEVNSLLARLGAPARYPSAAPDRK